MSHVVYVLTAWGVTLAAIGLYAAALRVRGQRLLRRVRAEQSNGDE